MLKYLKIRIMYLCWHIVSWMDTHKPYYPLWLRIKLLNLYPETRHHMTRDIWNRWISNGYNPSNNNWKPLPWFIGVSALGPFVKYWNLMEKPFRKIRGNHAHRCDFTDKNTGLLHGGDGEAMNRLWEKFMYNIKDNLSLQRLNKFAEIMFDYSDKEFEDWLDE